MRLCDVRASEKSAADAHACLRLVLRTCLLHWYGELLQHLSVGCLELDAAASVALEGGDNDTCRRGVQNKYK